MKVVSKMKNKMMTSLLLLLLVISTVAAKPSPTKKTANVRLKITPYCMIDISGPVDVTVIQPGQVPENRTKVKIACNFNYNVRVNWKLPKSWPKGVTTHDNITGHNISSGIRKGDIWLSGITSFKDLATIYNGVVVVTISSAQ